jgi:hypothetical protein
MPAALPTCNEKLRLLIAYQKSISGHSDAIGKLVVRDISPAEYQRLSAIAERARLTAQQTRDQLNSHIAEHGC